MSEEKDITKLTLAEIRARKEKLWEEFDEALDAASVDQAERAAIKLYDFAYALGLETGRQQGR